MVSEIDLLLLLPRNASCALDCLTMPWIALPREEREASRHGKLHMTLTTYDLDCIVRPGLPRLATQSFI